jgi:glyoxylase-like metal-dependent hydrolase (beta-lactamase superfamily II)
MAAPLAEHTIELEGEELVAIELGRSETDSTTALHVPTLGLVAAGDALYNDVHLYLAKAGTGGTHDWLEALDTIDALHPSTVIAGHKRDGAEDSPDNIGKTRQYLHDFEAASRRTDNPRELYDSMIERYPDRINRAVVWNSTNAVKGGRQPRVQARPRPRVEVGRRSGGAAWLAVYIG